MVTARSGCDNGHVKEKALGMASCEMEARRKQWVIWSALANRECPQTTVYRLVRVKIGLYNGEIQLGLVQDVRKMSALKLVVGSE